MYAPHRILIVDDHPTNLAVLEELLGDTYPLSIATSGEEALGLVGVVRPALILLDVMMPGINGYETCRRLRALAHAPSAQDHHGVRQGHGVRAPARL